MRQYFDRNEMIRRTAPQLTGGVVGTPAGAVSKEDAIGGVMVGSGTEQKEYTIANGVTLTVRDFVGAAARGVEGGFIALFERTTLGGDVEIASAPLSELQDAILAVNQTFVGDGDRRIVVERKKTSAGNQRIISKWIGHEV